MNAIFKSLRHTLLDLILGRPMLRKLTHKGYSGLRKIDRKIEKHLNYDTGFYVELGANDGINQSNTLYFKRYRKWKGILIEPYKPNFLSCVKNRGPADIVVNAACVSFGYTQESVELTYANLMTVMNYGISDLPNKKNHIENSKRFLSENETHHNFLAPAKTLNSILEKHSAPKLIDFLSLDVEGSELEVLKGLDHSTYRFKLICVETRSFENMKKYLESNNYLFLEKISTHDYLFESKTSN